MSSRQRRSGWVVTKRALTLCWTILFRSILRSLGEDGFEEGEPSFLPNEFLQVPKPPLFFFDFVEICGGGAGRVSDAMASLGHVVAPVLDLSMSSFYNLCELRLLEWVLHMLAEKRFGSCMVEPPCTTFSPAAHPAVRSYDVPVGWDRLLPKVLHGNTFSFSKLGRGVVFPEDIADPAFWDNFTFQKWHGLQLGVGF